MPHFEHYPYPCRYNTLRLLGYEYNSIFQLCAITLVVDSRRPVFADVVLAKACLASLLSDMRLEHMRLRVFSLMPDHFHLVAGVREPDRTLPDLLGDFKSYTTQLYWKRCGEIVATQRVSLPSTCVIKSNLTSVKPVLSALVDGRATLRPEVVELRNWPAVKPEHFVSKRLWQTRFFDHVIRNDSDLHENLNYIAMNPVRAGYVTHPAFYPYTGFL